MNYIKKFYLTTALCSIISATAVQAEVLARINGKREVTSEQVDNQIKALPPEIVAKNTDLGKLKKQVLEQLIDINVMFQAALESDVEKNPEVQAALKSSREQVITQAYIIEKLKPKLTDQALQDKYKQIKEEFPKDKKESKVRHILVKEEKDALSIIEKLKEGTDFQKLARESSIDKESAKEGGDLGYIIDGMLVPEFEKAANNLQPGKYTTAPVKTQFGYHVIKVEDRRAAKMPKFDNIKSEIAKMVQQEALLGLVKNLRDSSKIEFLNDAKNEVKAPVNEVTADPKDKPKINSAA